VSDEKLSEVDIDQLRIMRDSKQNEADVIQEEILRRIKLTLQDKQVWYMEHIDILLQLVPDHYRQGCTDEQLYNQTSDCIRCYLLDCKQSHCWLDPECDLDIDISLFNVNYRQKYYD
jgi:hypothetical protein